MVHMPKPSGAALFEKLKHAWDSCCLKDSVVYLFVPSIEVKDACQAMYLKRQAFSSDVNVSVLYGKVLTCNHSNINLCVMLLEGDL